MTTVVTTNYYLGGTLVAQRENTTLRYAHQDHLSGTSLMTDTSGNSLGTMKYYPYGSARSGSVPTDELFTCQKLDGTGLYYYGSRYYDPTIGRFISPDTIIPNPADPQSFNRYSYCLNNPLKYVDPSGHIVRIGRSLEYSCHKQGPSKGKLRVRQIGNGPESDKAVEDAWKLFRDTCPNIAQMLEDSDEIITVSFGRTIYDAETSPTGTRITINPKHLADGTESITTLVSHEVVHSLVRLHLGETADSMYEEMVAFMFQNQVANITGDRLQWVDIMSTIFYPYVSSDGLENQLDNAQNMFITNDPKTPYGELNSLPSEAVQLELYRYFLFPVYVEQMVNIYGGS